MRVSENGGKPEVTFSVRDKKASSFGDVHTSTATNAVFSPDGRWVAYQSDETRTNGVFVQPFPATGAKYLVPKVLRDDQQPLWSPDGKELFYSPGPNRLVVASIATEPRVAFGIPAPIPNGGGFQSRLPTIRRPFDIFPDGKQFIGVLAHGQNQTPSGAARDPQIQVVLNWFEDVKRLVPLA